MLVCWAVKGGSGTTVVSAALALLWSRQVPTVLVDLAGDCPVVLGCPEPSGPGVREWLVSAHAGSDALERLCVPVTDTLRLIPAGRTDASDSGGGGRASPERWEALADSLTALGQVIVDAGTGVPPPAITGTAEHSLLVIRPCFLALRRATLAAVRPTGIILVNEPGRALRSRDVEHALGAPVVAEVAMDPAVSRAVDAGLLASRLPRSLAQQLRGAA